MRLLQRTNKTIIFVQLRIQCWFDYRYSNFSEVIRYTRSFTTRIPVVDERGNLRYFKTKIVNEYWNYAIEFTKNAANLSLTKEDEFVEKFIITECEAMVEGLQNIYTNSQFDLIDENQVNIEEKNSNRHRVDIKGFELIRFKTEKIIGALDFMGKIIEYNKIIPTDKYIKKIKELNKKFIPHVHKAIIEEKKELSQAKKDLDTFFIGHNQLVKKNEFYQKERIRLKENFADNFSKEYTDFLVVLKDSMEQLERHEHKVTLHTQNIQTLDDFIKKYNDFMEE